MSDFHFAAARITAAQICRAMGLERSVPSVLDTFTDILIQYLTMLGSTARDVAESRGSTDAEVDDVLLAAVQCKALPGGLQSVELRNDLSSASAGIEDIIEFQKWLRGPEHARIVTVARPQKQSNASIGAAQGAALAALPSSHAAASQFNDQDITSQQNPPNVAGLSAESDKQLSRTTTNETTHTQASTTQQQPDLQQDWLRMALNRQALLGHRDWFVNTEIGPHTDPDPTLYG